MALRGERLDKPSYAILRSIKGGAAGEVYEAQHLVFGRRCVQKTYSTIGLEDAAAHEEPRLLHEMKHPHVAEVLEAQYDPDIKDAITFVTVYYEGRCVAIAFDEDYRFSVHQAIGIAIDALDALAYVHNDPGTRSHPSRCKAGQHLPREGAAERQARRLGEEHPVAADVVVALRLGERPDRFRGTARGRAIVRPYCWSSTDPVDTAPVEGRRRRGRDACDRLA